MKEVPIEKGTGQSDFKIAANCDKKNLLTIAFVGFYFFFFFFFFWLLYELPYTKKRTILRIDVWMVTFSIHIGIVKKCVSSNRFFFFRSFHDQNNAELRLALISSINEKLYD